MACRKNSLRLSPRLRRSFSTESKIVEVRLTATFTTLGMMSLLPSSYHSMKPGASPVKPCRWRAPSVDDADDRGRGQVLGRLLERHELAQQVQGVQGPAGLALHVLEPNLPFVALSTGEGVA